MKNNDAKTIKFKLREIDGDINKRIQNAIKQVNRFVFQGMVLLISESINFENEKLFLQIGISNADHSKYKVSYAICKSSTCEPIINKSDTPNLVDADTVRDKIIEIINCDYYDEVSKFYHS